MAWLLLLPSLILAAPASFIEAFGVENNRRKMRWSVCMIKYRKPFGKIFAAIALLIVMVVGLGYGSLLRGLDQAMGAYNQGDPDAALPRYDATEPRLLEEALHAAEDTLRDSLHLNPNDWDAKYNFEYVNYIRSLMNQDQQGKIKILMENVRVEETRPAELPADLSP